MNFNIAQFPPEVRAVLYNIAAIVGADLAGTSRYLDGILEDQEEREHNELAMLEFIAECDREEAKEHNHMDNIKAALQHIEANRKLAVEDLKFGDGYEALEYLDNMVPWIKAMEKE